MSFGVWSRKRCSDFEACAAELEGLLQQEIGRLIETVPERAVEFVGAARNKSVLTLQLFYNAFGQQLGNRTLPVH